MFTNVAHHLQPHQFPHSSQYSLRGHYKDPPFVPPLPGVSHEHHQAVRHSVYQQRIQKPQQYAHPLQRPASLSTQDSLANKCAPKLETSEHMLRRKTPNGTLAAGYDGRPVEWLGRPHAVKHFLMPRSNAMVETKFQPHNSEWSPDSSLLTNEPNSAGRDIGQRRHIGNRNAVEKSGNENLIPLTEWRQNSQSVMGLDSVLHQGSMFHQYGNMAGNQTVPTALQPMWPPSVGLTSLNDPGPYGPYWPDGAFVPYRPALLRDPQYLNQITEAPGIGVSHFQPPADNGGEWNAVLDQPTYHHDLAEHTSKLMGGNEVSDAYLVASSENPNQNNIFSYTQDAHIPQRRQIPLSYRGKPHSSRCLPEPSINRWGGSPRCSASGHSITSHSTFQKTNLYASHAQFKDKVLVWAHRVYVSLLASTQYPRRNGSTSEHHNDPQLQPNTYSKPSRQPFSNLSGTHDCGDQNHEGLKNRAGAPQETIDTSSQHADQWHPFLASPNKLLNEQYSATQCSIVPPLSGPQRYTRQPWQPKEHETLPQYSAVPDLQPVCVVPPSIQYQHETSPSGAAANALEMLERLCQESGWEWTEGMLLGGCLAYGLGDHNKAMKWYTKVLLCDPNNVEAMSNLAATLLSLNRRDEAEQHWIRSIKLRPSFFEAIEHLVGLLCEDHRGKEAINIIGYVQQALRTGRNMSSFALTEASPESAGDVSLSPCISVSERSDYGISDRESLEDRTFSVRSLPCTGFGSSGYAIPPSDNGRMLALIHGKGNMLYALGDNTGAAKAFEDTILIGAGKRHLGIRGLIRRILSVFADRMYIDSSHSGRSYAAEEPILLPPEMALETSQLVFPSQGQLPGLKEVSHGIAKRAAVSIVSNSLLSLAKIYQDGMSSSGASANGPRATSGVQDILALYYLSLSLQPSPSTANNVGILLASVQQSASSKAIGPSILQSSQLPGGVMPGSGIALALAYYKYGLNLDSRHAHLYTNLGSLFKDIGHLSKAIQMYEKAVDCDRNFDIALANLANAVKDQGRISDAIAYYRRAVSSNPDFAEAVCGLANALNSVCSWSGRGGVSVSGENRDRWHVDVEGMLYDGRSTRFVSSGWIERVVTIVEKQLRDGEGWGKGVLHSINVEDLLKKCNSTCDDREVKSPNAKSMKRALENWAEKPWEGAKIVRLVERATKRLGWEWYWDKYIRRRPRSTYDRTRPQLPAALAIPSAPTVLPFHTFTCPLSARQIRRISQRNGLRISCSTLRAPWLPTQIYEPPAPPNPQLHIGYVSSDFNNHPLAHLMQSVFGLHNKARVKAFCYATTAGDGSVHRQQIEREAPRFYDASSWSIDRLVNQVVEDGIHILVNLNGYTRGARNEVFAARPAPIQMSFMGFAGTLGAEWCDYLLADKIAVPPQTLRPWRRNIDLWDQIVDKNSEDDPGDWVYGENLIFTRDTFFCCDHRQSAPDSQEGQLSWADEQMRRWRMRRELFPDLTDDTVILGNFNQLYKIEPTTFRTWLRILSRIPKAVLWLLRFPDLGEKNLRQTALRWVGSEVASRIIFTDVAPKHQHISRARVCDLFLDTPECNAHTTAADVLWSGTPLLTLPRYEYKMCSRMAASILRGALPKTAEGDCAMEDLVVRNDDEYEERAVELGLGLVYPTHGEMQGRGRGRLMDLRKLLYESRWESALFDTRRWVRDLESAYGEAWRRWVAGEGGDIWL